MPSTAAYLANNVPAVVAHLHYLGRLRGTNASEPSLTDVCRRPEVISRLPAESVLTLCWAVVDCIITGAKGLGRTEPDRQCLSSLRQALPDQDKIA